MSMLWPSRSGTRPEVAPGTVVVYTDVVCGWSTVALHGLARARAEAGLDDTVAFDLRLFPLEEINRFPIPKKYLDAELPVFGALEPQGDPGTGFPVVDSYDPDVFGELVARAEATTRRS